MRDAHGSPWSEVNVSERPLILLSNDDGVHAKGLLELASALACLGDVFVVAPEREQSASSHRITLSEPLRHRELGANVHAVDGTPADCIYVALNLKGLLPRRPAVLVSGINHGLNLGMDVVYSGTVAAAREGALRGLRAAAFSADPQADMALVAAHAAGLVERLLALSTPLTPLLFNVNYPRQVPLGVKPTRLGRREYEDLVEARTDPRGRSYYWIGGPVSEHDCSEGADTTAVDGGYVSITPLALELTNYAQHGLAAELSGQYSDPADRGHS
ncbi:MAG: 5-nucleotidase SurE [Myxococcaceae bacterium]|nr:5-nucleotidase SurE [Myxococcaceae bacterium]